MGQRRANRLPGLRALLVVPAVLLTVCPHPWAPATLEAQETGPGAGLRIQPWAAVFFRGADPNLQPTPLFLDVRSGGAADPAVRGVAGVALDLRLGRYLSAGARAHYDTDPTNSPLARTRKVGPLDSRGELDQFWVRVGGGVGALTVGRMSLMWGPSPRGGLVLSGQAPAMDMVHGKLNLWGHSLESFLANLSGAGEDLRILYGHRGWC